MEYAENRTLAPINPERNILLKFKILGEIEFQFIEAKLSGDRRTFVR